MILKYGTSQCLITDRGSHFRNELLMSISNLCGIKQNATTAYHPEGNGLVERQMGPLAEGISMFVDENQKDWDVFVKYVIFAHNVAIHSTTKITPFYALFGRDPNLPVDTIIKSRNTDEFDDLQDYVKIMVERISEATELARVRMDLRNDINAEIYDKNRKRPTFLPAVIVHLRSFTRKTGKADILRPKYQGPCKVLRECGENVFKLETTSGRHMIG